MTQKVKLNKQLRIAQTSRRSRRLAGLVVIAILTLGLALSADNAPRVPGFVGFTLDIELASVARLSVLVSMPHIFFDDPAVTESAEGAGIAVRLTLLRQPGIDSINYSL